MALSEKTILTVLQLEASERGNRLFRNNVGTGWVGRIAKRGLRSITIADPRPLHAGLCEGSSDLIGWTRVTITPDMIGETLAVFTAIEVKTGRVRMTDAQRAFLDAVNDAGGIAQERRE